MVKRMLVPVIAVSVMALVAAGCGEDSKKSDSSSDKKASSAMTSTEDKMEAKGVDVGGVMTDPSKNIVENAAALPNFSTLVTAVTAAGLAETLSGGEFTVFAPDNDAFAAVPKATLDDLLKPENKEQLTSVLTYHVVPGKAMAADLTDGQELTTVQGDKLKVKIVGDKVMINDATVALADVAASNGVIHAIDAVLLPPTK